MRSPTRSPAVSAGPPGLTYPIIVESDSLSGFPTNQTITAMRNAKPKAKSGTGRCHDDLVQRLYRRKLAAIRFYSPLERFHRRELRNCDVAACWNAAKTVFDAIDLLAPDWLTKPDGKFFHNQSAPPGSQKVSQLMNENEQVEEEDNLQANKEKLQKVKSHSGQKKSFAVNR